MTAGGGAGPQGPGQARDADAQATAPGTPPPAPDLEEALRQVGAAGKSSLDAASDAAKAFRSLFFADVSLGLSHIR